MEDDIFYKEEVICEEPQVPKVKVNMQVCKPDILFSKVWKTEVMPVIGQLAEQSNGCFTVYEIMLSLQSGSSIICIGTLDDGSFAGFTILELGGGRMGSQTDGPSIWIAYIIDRLRGSDAVYQGAKFVEELASKSLGAKAIYSISYDDNLSAMFKKIGFSQTQKATYFRKELTSGR